jgi:hypothetical protein
MTMTDLRERVANAIRRAAFGNSHCSCVPGPHLAGIYADAAIAAMQTVESWHGTARPQEGQPDE